MNLSETERTVLTSTINQLAHANQQMNSSLINQTLLIQALINLLKTKFAVKIVDVPQPTLEDGTPQDPIKEIHPEKLLVDQEIVDEFVKVRNQFLKDTQKPQIITPEPGITVVEKKVEVAQVPTANPE